LCGTLVLVNCAAPTHEYAFFPLLAEILLRWQLPRFREMWGGCGQWRPLYRRFNSQLDSIRKGGNSAVLSGRRLCLVNEKLRSNKRPVSLGPKPQSDIVLRKGRHFELDLRALSALSCNARGGRGERVSALSRGRARCVCVCVCVFDRWAGWPVRLVCRCHRRPL